MPRGSKKSRGIRPNIKAFSLKRNLSGMDQNRDETFLTPDKAVDIINMHATGEGTWSSNDAGYTVLNSGGTAYESGADIDGMHWFTGSTSSNKLFLVCNAKLKEINTGSGVATDRDTSTGFTATNKVSFAELNNVLYYTDGTTTAPRKWNNSSAGDASGWSVNDGTSTYGTPKYLLIFQNRLVGLNIQSGTGADGSKFVISDFDDPETFTFAGSASTESYIGDTADGGDIVGGITIRAALTNTETMVVYKRAATYMVTGASALDTDDDYFQVIKVNGQYGAFNENCIIEVGGDVLAFNEYGITSLSTSNQSGTIQPLAIDSDKIKTAIQSINLNAVEQCWAEHLPSRKEVIFHFPTGANSECNEAIVYKYPSPGSGDPPKWSRRKDAGGAYKPSCGVVGDSIFYIGFYNGLIGSMFTSSKYGSTGIPWTYEYPFYAAGNEKQNKRVLNADAHFRIRSSQSVGMTTTWFGGGNNDTVMNTLSLSTAIEGAIYGVAVYGTSYYGEQTELKKQFQVLGDGLKVKFKLTGTTSDSGVDFLGINVLSEFGNYSQHWN